MKQLIMMMGPSGSGKTRMAKFIESTHENCAVVSKSQFQSSILPKTEADVHKDYLRVIKLRLEDHDIVVADDLQIEPYARKKMVEDLSLPDDVKIIGIWIETAMNNCINTVKPKTHAAKAEIQRQFRVRIAPHEDEHFDNLIYIMTSSNQASSTSDPTIRSVVDTLRLM